MTDKIKEALKDMEEAKNEVEKLSIWNNSDSSDKGTDYLDSNALAKDLEKLKLAQIRYCTLMGWSQGKIESWLKEQN